MSIYTSNVNRVTGLSGIDTESMIDKMMKAEGAKYDRLEKEKTKVTWKQEAFRKLIDSMQSFQDKWFSTSNTANNIGYDAFWNNYKTSIIDVATGKESNAISIKGTSASGRYEIDVKQKAETESITGTSISTNISTDLTEDEIINKIKENGSISLSFNLDGVSKTIDINANEIETNDLASVFNNKLSEKFGNAESGEGKVFVENIGGKLTFKASGQGHSLTIGDGNARKEGTSTEITLTGDSFTMKVGEYTVSATFSKEDDTDKKKLAKIQEALKKATKEGDKEGETTDISSKVSLSLTGDKLTVSNTSTTEELDVNGIKLKSTGSAHLLGLKNNTTNVTLGSKLTDVFGEKFNNLFEGKDEINLNFGGKDVTINKNDTIQSLTNKINSSDGDINIKFNEVTNRFTIESKQSGSSGNINIKDEDTKRFVLNIIGINVEDKEANQKYVKGQDAIFSVDGIETTRPSNDINMNGINFTINTTGKVVIDCANDVDGTVKKIKEFVEDYNKLIDDFNNAVIENRPKSGKYGYYEPLTDEEKKGMSEDEIKKYEEQAKKGLLYKDENINKFLSSLRDNIYKSVDIGGKTISLYEIGITTSRDYNSGGKLELNEEKLRKALQERGDEVKQLFTKSGDGIADSIKKSIDDAIGTKGYIRKKAGIKGTISATNNDLTKELKDITKRLSEERERLYNKEMYYFNLFAKMEASINKQNSQMAMLLGMSGQ